MILKEPRMETNQVAGQVSASQLTLPKPGEKKGPWFWDIISIWEEEFEGSPITLSDNTKIKVIPLFPELVLPTAVAPLGFRATRVPVKIVGAGAEQCVFGDVEPLGQGGLFLKSPRRSPMGRSWLRGRFLLTAGSRLPERRKNSVLSLTSCCCSPRCAESGNCERS